MTKKHWLLNESRVHIQCMKIIEEKNIFVSVHSPRNVKKILILKKVHHAKNLCTQYTINSINMININVALSYFLLYLNWRAKKFSAKKNCRLFYSFASQFVTPMSSMQDKFFFALSYFHTFLKECSQKLFMRRNYNQLILAQFS